MIFKALLNVLGASALCVMALACKRTNHSGIKGHFEDFSEAELQTYKGKLQIIPEHAESSGVIMSKELLSYPSLIESFLDHPDKIKLIVVTFETEMPSVKKTLNEMLAKKGAERERVSYIVLPTKSEFNVPIGWARDWGPWSVSYDDGSGERKLRFVDLNYFSEGNADADKAPSVMATQMQIGRVSLPIRAEGGNFMANSRGDCIIGEEIERKEQSSIETIQNHIDTQQEMLKIFVAQNNAQEIKGAEDTIQRLTRIKNSNKAHTQSEIDAIFRDYLGCKTVHTLASNPADLNGHIDLFAKFINDDTIIVAELEDKTVALAKQHMLQNQYHAPYLKFLDEVKNHLNTAASQLSAKKFNVVRVPLPLPYIKNSGLPQKDPQEIIFHARAKGATGLPHMRSYINSLILNKKVYVPRLTGPGFDQHITFPPEFNSKYVDADLLSEYEAKVKEGYGKAGLDVVFIDADSTFNLGGSIHCMTMQLGKVKP